MTEREIYSALTARFGEKILEFQDSETANPAAVVIPAVLGELMTYLKDSEDTLFDSLMCLSGNDPGAEEPLEVVYHLYSMMHAHHFTVKTRVPRENGHVPSVALLWRTADWHEREAYDMYGIVFDGHPDLKRILLEEDWEGHPLRKDYVAAETYRGMTIAKVKE